MRTHHHDPEESALRPKSARLDAEPPAPMMQAAATGHPDVLDPQMFLGLQRLVGNRGMGSMLAEDGSSVHEVVNSGGGSPLAPEVRGEMQSRLGHDFGDVRVHSDSRADASAKAVNAHAYTVGSNIVFQRDKYDPSSAAGKTMLAHELTHVVQQRSGPVDGTSIGGGVKLSDPSDRFEREAASNAEQVMAAPLAATASTQRSESGTSVQREEEEEAQGSFVQREEEEEAQGSFVQREEEEEAQGSFVQREEEEEAQGSFVQREEEEEAQGSFVQRAESDDHATAE